MIPAITVVRMTGARDRSALPLLVLGPSLGTSLALWDEVAPELAVSHRVVRWDLPGHGASAADLVTAGATVASETADAVIMADRIDRVVDAIQIGRRSLAIARQSIVVGMGLSLLAMVFAAVGVFTPVAGALLQEAIDVAVIANALRALRS